MLDQFIGYQEILMSSVKQLAEKETHKGNDRLTYRRILNKINVF